MGADLAGMVPDVATLLAGLDGQGYLADEALGTSLFLAARMGWRPASRASPTTTRRT